MKKDGLGYLLVYMPAHPHTKRNGWMPVHALVIEKHTGVYPKFPIVHVHHIDGNKTNNDIRNLVLLTPKEHVRLHRGWKRKGNGWIKLCKKCNRWLAVNKTNFSRNDLGFRAQCRKCRSAIESKRYHKHKRIK